MPRKMLDVNDPFFAKPWRRWVVSALPVAWSLVEFWTANPFWGILFLAAGGYAFWELILKPARDK